MVQELLFSAPAKEIRVFVLSSVLEQKRYVWESVSQSWKSWHSDGAYVTCSIALDLWDHAYDVNKL